MRKQLWKEIWSHGWGRTLGGPGTWHWSEFLVWTGRERISFLHLDFARYGTQPQGMILGAPTSLELSSEAQGPDARAEAQERPASGQVLTATLGVRWAVNIQGSGQGKRLDDDIMSVFHLTLSKCYLSKLKLGQHSVPAIEKKNQTQRGVQVAGSWWGRRRRKKPTLHLGRCG